MIDHISSQQLEGYLNKTLPPDELIRVDDHLSACDVCHQHLSAMLSLSKKPRVIESDESRINDEESDHVTYEQLAAYVDLELDEFDREIVESHITLCTQCSEETRSLSDLKKRIET